MRRQTHLYMLLQFSDQFFTGGVAFIEHDKGLDHLGALLVRYPDHRSHVSAAALIVAV